MHKQSAEVFDRFLGVLSGLLHKAEAHCAERKITPEAILAFRLYPDMFPFTRQVQLACDFATRAVSRLAGEEPKGFPDVETSFAELQARIAAARAHVATFPPDRLKDAATRTVTIKMRGEDHSFSGEDFLNFYALPQFWFHLTTAYDILRHNGVDLGKRHFMGAA
jgi:hypothetical protein